MACWVFRQYQRDETKDHAEVESDGENGNWLPHERRGGREFDW